MEKEIQKDLSKRLRNIKKETKNADFLITICEIKLMKTQMGIMAHPMFGWDKEECVEYMIGKTNGNILLSESDFVYREDQPDFQYLIDLGIQSIKDGQFLREENDTQNSSSH